LTLRIVSDPDQHTDTLHRPGLLRMRSERLRRRGATEQSNELTPLHVSSENTSRPVSA
jgi:3,4-dihydroxy-2-butanone 4-phosphate synthase